jgi:Ca2+:H+ antiporter
MSSHAKAPPRSFLARWLPDLPILLALLTGGVVLAHWSPAGEINNGANLLWSIWLVVCIVAAAFRAMAHADELAEKFGEPLGTVLLTVSAIIIEVAAVCAVMLGSNGDATVARDTMLSVLMILLNLLMGAVLLIGGLKRQEQEFNAQSASAYLPMIIALGAIALILPRFTRSADGGWMSDPMEVFVGCASLVIYLVFLYFQTTRHRNFYAHHHMTEREHEARKEAHASGEAHEPVSTWRSGTLLVLALVGVVAIAEGLAGRVQGLLAASYLPAGIGGVFIAALVLAPEGLAALKAAAREETQRAMNVLLGSSLSTIGLTVPAVLAIRWFTGVSPELGLDAPYIVLLVTTFLVAAINLRGGRVNAVQGVVHILLFLAFIVTILDEASVITVK